MVRREENYEIISVNTPVNKSKNWLKASGYTFGARGYTLRRSNCAIFVFVSLPKWGQV